MGRPRDGQERDGWVGQDEVNRRLGEVVLTTTSPHTRERIDADQYRAEKIMGLRLPGGQKPLKKLSVKHKNVIALHLRGLSNRDIAFITGLAEVTIATILRDPLAQEVIQTYIEGIDQELMALAPLAVDAVRSGLEDEEARVRLLAADRFFKATGRYAQAENKRESAEDVLARALARVAAQRAEGAEPLREVRRSAPVNALHRPRSSVLIEGSAEHVEDVPETGD